MSAACSLLLVSIAPGGMNTVEEPVAAIIRHLENEGRVVRIVHLDGDVTDAELCSRLYAQAELQSLPWVLGGFSRAARISAMIVEKLSAVGLLGFAYPFHTHGAPQEKPGLEALSRVRKESLVVQGTRDSHGNYEEVRGYGGVPSSVKLCWLEDGNHQLAPRARSGHTYAAHIQTAAAACLEFLRKFDEKP